jgi:branched-chain amino acid transport system substrate-binding protein
MKMGLNWTRRAAIAGTLGILAACSSNATTSSSTAAPTAAPTSTATAPSTAAPTSATAAPSSAAATSASAVPSSDEATSAPASTPAEPTTASAAPTTGASDTPFVVGAVLPLTGAFATSGGNIKAGLEAQAALLNANGGILGHQIEIQTRDDGSDPQKAVAALHDILAIENLGAVYPDPVSSTTIALDPLLTEAGILSLTNCAAPTCTDPVKYPYAFTLALPPANELAVLVTHVKDDLKTSKMGLMLPDDATGHSTSDALNQLAATAGITLTGQEFYDTNGTDFSAQLQNLRGGNPDVVGLFGSGTGPSVAMQGFLDLGWQVPVVGISGTAISADLIKTVPAEVQSQLTATTYRISMRTGDTPDAEYQPLIDALDKTGVSYTSLLGAGIAADGLLTIKYGYEKAGVLDPKAAAKMVEGLATDTSVSPDYYWVFRGTRPAFDATNHNPVNTDTSHAFWAIVHISPIVDGTLQGTPFGS